MKEIKAYCVVKKPNARKINTFIDNLKLTSFGTLERPFFNIHPYNKEGLEEAESNCNGYEQVAECKILILKKKPHKCNCSFCNIT